MVVDFNGQIVQRMWSNNKPTRLNINTVYGYINIYISPMRVII